MMPVGRFFTAATTWPAPWPLSSTTTAPHQQNRWYCRYIRSLSMVLVLILWVTHDLFLTVWWWIISCIVSCVYGLVFAGAAETDLQHSHLPVYKLHPWAPHVSRLQHVRATSHYPSSDAVSHIGLTSTGPLPSQPVSQRWPHCAVSRPHGQPVSWQPLGAEPHQVSGEFHGKTGWEEHPGFTGCFCQVTIGNYCNKVEK